MAQKKAARKKTGPRKAPDPRGRVIDAALTLAEQIGWRHTRLTDIADEAGLSLAELHALYPSKAAILRDFTRRIDETVLGGDFGDLADEPARDRLFDVLMRRLDALNPHKAALASILRDSACDPVAVLCGKCRVGRSMAWMLEAAGLSARGVRGCLRIEGLIAIWAMTVRVWLRDDSPDMAKTMAALDRNLTRVDRLIARCRRGGRSGPAEPEATPA